MKDTSSQLDLQAELPEFEFPETTYIRDIENRVFQEIVLQCLSHIKGITLLEGTFIDHILGRAEGITGIHAEQDPKNNTISVKIEVNIDYGLPIPEKAEEIQIKVVQALTRLTGLHVAQVHVVFKQLSKAEPSKHQALKELPDHPGSYSDIF